MADQNCLEGIACPRCGCRDTFEIEAVSSFVVTDDGCEHTGDTWWDEGSVISCHSCRHEGRVRDFTTTD